MSTSRASRKAQRQARYYSALQWRLYMEVTGAQEPGCEVCGYNHCIAALHLHHVFPNKTRSFNQRTWSPKDLDDPAFMAEAKSCHLLCANCHAETHSIQQSYRLHA